MSISPASRIPLAIGTLLTIGVLAACSGGTAQPAAPQAPMPGYGPGAAPAAATPSPTASAPSTDAATLALKMADSPLGEILVDGKGMTLYMFTKDSPNMSACEGKCLVAWPPLLGEPTQGAGVDDSKLGSFTRADGRTQATYNGWPLYYWQGDSKPGDTTGQDVQKVWYVLDRDGEPIKG